MPGPCRRLIRASGSIVGHFGAVTQMTPAGSTKDRRPDVYLAQPGRHAHPAVSLGDYERVRRRPLGPVLTRLSSALIGGDVLRGASRDRQHC